MHDLVELHEIELNSLSPSPERLGFGPIAHAEPSDCTSSGAVKAARLWWVNEPTAKHFLGEGHDTLFSCVCEVPASLGTRCTTHLEALAAGAPTSQQPITKNETNT